MSIVFLDIDGVLLPFGAYNWDLDKVLRRPYNYLERLVKRTDKEALNGLRQLLWDRQAKFVLISTWRYLFDDKFLLDYLSGIGFTEEFFHPDWVARHPHNNYADKGPDISIWLMKHPEVKDWLVVDDMDCKVPEGHWIKTDPHVGYRHEGRGFNSPAA
jgi:hypothetical protein